MEESQLLIDRPHGYTRATLVLAHGAGAGMDHPFMDSMASQLAAGGIRVVRFEFPYMRKRRRDGKRRAPDRSPVLENSWREVVGLLRVVGRLLIGGKSMGGRIASMVADDCGVGGLVCLGYPFHPPGRPERLRTAHLRDLKTPTLIVQGERDAFGRPEEVSGYDLSSKIRVLWIADGDHSLKPRKSSGRTHDQNLSNAVREILRFERSLSG